MINTFIIDDESDKIKTLSLFLEKYCWDSINIIGTSNSRKEGVKLIEELSPELVFLDVILGDGTGFDVLNETKHKNLMVIFTTGYNKYAVEAFRFNAIDYLLKPVQIDELKVAVSKSVMCIKKKQYTSDTQKTMLLKTIQSDSELDFIAISSLDKIHFVRIKDIIYFKSEGSYTFFFLHDKIKITATKNLGEYYTILENKMFFRIHNSFVVNLKHVKNINKSDGNYCEMTSGDKLPIAKRRLNPIKSFIGL